MAVALPAGAEEAGVNAELNSGPGSMRVELQQKMEARIASTTRERLRMNAELEARKASTTERLRMNAELEARRASTTLRMEDKKERMASTTERREEMKAEMEVKRASSTARRVEMQQGIAKKRAEHAGKMLLATIERLEKILMRVETRIAKVKAEGGVTAESEANIGEAKIHLQAARTSLEAFASIDLSADKANENFENIKELAQTVKTHIKEAHESLMKAVRALKPGRPSGNATTTRATTTATSTSN